MKYLCPQCGYHGDTIRGIVPTECWSCGAKLPEHLCQKCGNELHKTVVTDPIPPRLHGTYYTCPTAGCGYKEKVRP